MEKGNHYRVGNFDLMKNEVGGIEYINVMTLQGMWGLSLSTQSSMGALIETMIDDEQDFDEALQTLLVNFLSSSSIIDANFQKKLVKLIEKYVTSIEPKIVGEQEDAKTVETLKTLHEMGETANGLENGEG